MRYQRPLTTSQHTVRLQKCFNTEHHGMIDCIPELQQNSKITITYHNTTKTDQRKQGLLCCDNVTHVIALSKPHQGAIHIMLRYYNITAQYVALLQHSSRMCCLITILQQNRLPAVYLMKQSFPHRLDDPFPWPDQGAQTRALHATTYNTTSDDILHY